ncbi:MAG: hypothetical protein D6738_02855 [Acidobacteria bacterium]|nr:MAG: hypothetical protein D6738_02855 [Acidobacteriota bacterium]
MHEQRGSGLIEFLVALGILTICMLSAVVYISSTMQGTRMNADKDFAIQKAISILEELKGIFESKTGNDATLLDGYDDGTTTDPVLTIQDGVTDPLHPASGNVHDGVRWRFERQISVEKFPSVQSNDVRLVRVRVYAWQQGVKRQLAEVSSVIRTIADSYPPSQVYDVYCLAIENVPGWWVYMANLVPFVENAIADLEARNPGLEFRVHWVRELAYGRDRQYRPYVNEASDSVADIDWVYFYPGRMPAGEAVNYYYVPSSFRGEVSIDGTAENDYDGTTNPWPYALADQYNHAMRHEDERQLFDNRVAAGLEVADTPTWRLLIDDMFMHPEKYENAILINVHGELFPFPPVRNFSDPAKEPVNHAGVRVVTHPEYLRYDNADDVKLRVYSWLADPDAVGAPDMLNVPISVLIRGATSIPGLQVEAIEGGLDLNPADGSPDPYSTESFDTVNSYTGDMYYQVSVEPEGVLIKLYNSPLRTPCVGGGGCPDGGLPTEKRLYDMDYIPTPLSLGAGFGPFSRDLTVDEDRTKNTARWIITLPDADIADNEMITIETRIGDDLTTGTLYPTANEPPNLSRTYVYRGDDTWVYGDGTPANPPHLPLTERFQVMGDPRHVPYADVSGNFDATTNPLGDGYNRYFDDFHNGSGNRAADNAYWPGFQVKNDGSSTNDGWYTASGDVEVEVNRCFQMLRDALLKSHAVYTTMTGFSYYYIGTGNEIGYDCANAFCNSIPVSRKPFDGGSGLRYEMSITTASSGGVNYIRSNETGNDWWSINWLGELYPDSEYSTWAASGNIASGSGPGTFVRVRRPDITTNLPTGTSFQNATRRLTQEGSKAFFSIGTSSSKFHHQFKNGQFGSLTGDGLDIANYYNFPIPNRAEINRPFNVNLNSSGGVPDDYQDPAYYNGTLTGTAINHFYDHDTSSLLGSSMIKLDGSLGDDYAFIVVNGLAQTSRTGSAFIGRWSFLTLIQGFLAAGAQTGAERIPQLPRIEITSPNDVTDLNDPSSISIAWSSDWHRWDGRQYTSAYSSTFSESATVSYALLYSEDNGKTWKHMQDDSPAVPGRRPSDGSLLETGSSYTWSTPSSTFDEGTYLVRVEAFLDGRQLHYSYHQRRIFIKR